MNSRSGLLSDEYFKIFSRILLFSKKIAIMNKSIKQMRTVLQNACTYFAVYLPQSQIEEFQYSFQTFQSPCSIAYFHLARLQKQDGDAGGMK